MKFTASDMQSLPNVVQPSPPPSFRTFSSPQKEIPYRFSSHSTFPPLSLPWATTNLLSVPVDLRILGIPCKRNHTVCGLLCLASFPLHNVFKVHSRCCTCQYFIPFCGCIIFHGVHILHFIDRSVCLGLRLYKWFPFQSTSF